jgi:hypothetical protein
MKMKRIFAILGSLIILGVGLGVANQQNPAREKNQVQEKNEIRNGPKGGEQTALQNRLMFRDENGDGICDSYRDHDNDGIPNGQDPDWSRAKDGKGNQGRFGNKNSGNKNGIRNGQGGSNKQAFRQSRGNAGMGQSGKGNAKGNSGKGRK